MNITEEHLLTWCDNHDIEVKQHEETVELIAYSGLQAEARVVSTSLAQACIDMANALVVLCPQALIRLNSQ